MKQFLYDNWLDISLFKERLFGRQEESLHESLQEAMAKILPTMVPFLNSGNLKVQASSVTVSCGCICTVTCVSIECLVCHRASFSQLQKNNIQILDLPFAINLAILLMCYTGVQQNQSGLSPTITEEETFSPLLSSPLLPPPSLSTVPDGRSDPAAAQGLSRLPSDGLLHPPPPRLSLAQPTRAGRVAGQQAARFVVTRLVQHDYAIIVC